MASLSSASLERILTDDALGHHVLISSSSYSFGKENGSIRIGSATGAVAS